VAKAAALFVNLKSRFVTSSWEKVDECLEFGREGGRAIYQMLKKYNLKSFKEEQ